MSIGKNVCLEDSIIFSNCVIGDNVKVKLSVVGPDCTVMNSCEILNNSVLGNNVQMIENQIIDNRLVQSTKPTFCEFNFFEWSMIITFNGSFLRRRRRYYRRTCILGRNRKKRRNSPNDIFQDCAR